MYCYRIAEITLQSCYELPRFSAFACSPGRADVTLEGTDEPPVPGPDQYSGAIAHRRLPDGWFFHSPGTERTGLYVSGDYSRLRLLGQESGAVPPASEQWIRIALECRLARAGYVTLHSAAVELDGEVCAFTGPSGIGKSTRAYTWLEAFGAGLVSGDRPLIRVSPPEVYGVPWDGKEQCYRNVCFPLKAILDVRRSESDYLRALSVPQRRRLLTRQCFLPMWDTETAAVQMANIARLSAGAEIIRVFCGRTPGDAEKIRDLIRNRQYLKEEPDMKAKSGFVLRHVVDEYILMPTGDNIGRFNGTVLFNEVTALVWEKLQNPVSRDDLLRAVLEEFSVDEQTASADLDRILDRMRDYSLLEEE